MVYMNAAKAHPLVMGILEFGLWVTWQDGYKPQYQFQIPQIFDLEERLANSVVIKK